MWFEKKLKNINITAEKLLKKSIKRSVVDLDGDLAEVGVSIGDSAEVICKNKGNRNLHLFDTFEGHPDTIGKYDISQTVGKHKADIKDVKERLQKYKNVFFYKGIFPKTSDKIKDKKFCFVNLDTDLYTGTYDGLGFFVPRMVDGGIIVVHDAPGIPGVVCAIVDFFEKKENKRFVSCELIEGSNQAYISF